MVIAAVAGGLILALCTFLGMTGLPTFFGSASGPLSLGLQFAVLGAICFALAIYATVRAAICGQLMPFKVTAGPWLVALTAAGALSLWNAKDPGDAWVGLAFCGGLLLLYFAVIHGANSMWDRRALWLALWLVPLIEAVVALAQLLFVHGTPAYWLSPAARAVIPTRVTGTLGNPNFLGAFMLLGLAVAGAGLLLSPRRYIRIVLSLSFTAEFLALLVTYSRGAYAGAGLLLASSLLFLGPHRKEALRRLWPVLGAAVALTVLMPGVLFRLHAVSVHQATSISRFYTWRTVLAAWHSSPWIGTGLGSINAVFGRFQPLGIIKPYSLLVFPGAADNDYLQLLLETGLLGIALATGGLMLTLARLRHIWKQTTERQRILLAVTGGGLLAVAVQAVFEVTLFLPMIAVMIVLLLALVTLEIGQEDRVLALTGARRALPLAMLGALALGVVVVIPWIQGMRMAHAAAQALAGQGAVLALTDARQAVRLDPAAESYRLLQGRLLLTQALTTDRADPGSALRAARKAYQAAIRLSPDEASGFFGLAQTEMAMGAQQAAWRTETQALARNPYNPFGLLTAGTWALKLGNRIAAAQDLRLASRMLAIDVKVLRGHHVPKAELKLVQRDRLTARTWLGRLQPSPGPTPPRPYGVRTARLQTALTSGH